MLLAVKMQANHRQRRWNGCAAMARPPMERDGGGFGRASFKKSADLAENVLTRSARILE
jgi:hypothetical protein